MNQNLKITNKTIVFAGGGTGGHIWPLISIARYIKKNLGARVIYFGVGTILERRKWRSERIRSVTIPSGKIRSYRSLWNIIDPLIVPLGTIKALFWLVAYRPAFVFGKGGYGMLPTAIAARFLGIKVISHESDIVLGKSNNKILDWGGMILTAFPVDLYNVDPQKCQRMRYVGMPVHPDFYYDKLNDKRKVKNTILVFGGSQGAERINKLVARMWGELSELGEVIHITGPNNFNRYKYMLKKQDKRIQNNISLHPEIDDLPAIISGASVVICRGGATSLWELATAETPAVVIPLPEASGDHQRLNALWLSQEFPWITVVEEKNILPSRVLGLIKSKLSLKIKDYEPSKLIMPSEALAETSQVIKEALTANYLKSSRHFHLIGSEGVSMKGIAKVLKQMGHKVTGSDITLGGHSTKNITPDIDAVIYSSAAATESAPGNIEIDTAKKKGIPVIKRSRFINLLINNKKIIAVSGMHGKSTVATMIAFILKKAGYDPSYFIGVPDDSGNEMGGSYWGRGGMVVVEACEYDRSFCDFNADILIITNIEKEHIDYFRGGLPEIEKSFSNFIERSRPSANLIAGRGESVEKVISEVESDRPDVKIIKPNIPQNIKRNEFLIFGDHNFIDASLAIATTQIVGINEKDAWQILKQFKGANRRMQYMGKYQNTLIYDDYGHHPTEIAACINAFRQKYKNKKLTLIFQPHQIHRTKTFFDDFVKVLVEADKVIVTDIYEVAGREEEENITSEKLVSAINEKKKDHALFIPLPYSKIVEYLKNNISDYEGIILTIGATNIYRVAQGLIDGK